MVSSDQQAHVPIAKVKIKENILKTEVIKEDIENMQKIQVCEQHEDKISTLVLETTQETVVVTTCEDKSLGFKSEERVENLNTFYSNREFSEIEVKKTNTVRYLNIKFFDCSSNKTIYCKSSKIKIVLKKKIIQGGKLKDSVHLQTSGTVENE